MVRKSLGRQLAALRHAAGVRPSQVAASKIASTSKLHRLEHGEVSVRLETVWALCDLYKASPEVKSRLSAMSLNTDKNGWWEGFSDLIVNPHFGTYVELESIADGLCAWEEQFVHGLFQVPEYTAAIFDAHSQATGLQQDRNRQVAFRRERQKNVFNRANAMRMSIVLGAGALLQQVGGARALDAQRKHLLTVAERPGVDILVLPWTAPAHALMGSSLSLLHFDAEDIPDVAYVEALFGGRYEEAAATVSLQRKKYDHLLSLAVPIEEYLR
ncbi:helix-turn-helix transcriptional regulator [Kineosporia mesophila]|uniref:helix-turn-helix domain-containing protein n=1 Tax=Kineosporia mesophila TaxID=566012 RepID=UPI0031EF6FCB